MKDLAFGLFDKLPLGKSLIIRDTAPRDPKAFIQYAKDYIDLGGGLEFNKDYTVLTKTLSKEEIAEWIRVSELEHIK